MTRYFILPIAIFLVFANSLYTQNDWQLVKNSEDIRVYIKELPDQPEYVNIKAVTFTNGSVASFVKVMQDVASYNEWMHAVKETFVVSRESDFHFSYYMLTDFPWPAKDRDAVIDMNFNWIPAKQKFITKSKNIRGLIPEKDNIKRVEEVDASYTFIQKSNKSIKIEYKGKIKPGVQLPDWLLEQVYHIAPYNTLKNLREFVQNNKYQKSTIDLDKI